jgi:AcrR family transcriptional regulator
MADSTRTSARSGPSGAGQDAEAALIRRAAFKVMARSPHGSCSVQDILAEAGLSTRAFYRHFASKDELIIDMYRTDSERTMAQLADAVQAAANPIEALFAWIDHWVALAYDQRRHGHIRVLGSLEAQSARGFRAAFADGMEPSRAVLRAILADGVATGDFPTADPTLDARALQAFVGTYVTAQLNHEPGPGWSEARVEARHVASRLLGLVAP